MTQIELLAEAGIDFLEVSGGSYEDPKVRQDAFQSILRESIDNYIDDGPR